MSYCNTDRLAMRPRAACIYFLTVICCALRIASVLGGDAVQLTKDGVMKFTPSFTNNGNELLFVSLVKPTQMQINQLDVEAGSMRPLHAGEANHELDIAVSRDGKYYAYIKAVGTLSTSIEIQDFQGNKIGHVDPASGFASYRSLAFAPDNSRLLFVFPENTDQQIFSVSLKGEDRQQLTHSQGISNWPCFSPDGKEIVFGSTQDGNFEIYKMDVNGEQVRRLTNSPTMDMRPMFSPDGKRISFTSNRDGNYEIYLMAADGTELQRVTDHPERDDYCSWHPDGGRLVYVSERNGHHDLYSVAVP